MRREEVQSRVAELDREINTELAGTKLPDSATRRSLPISTFILAAASFGWYFYGSEFDLTRASHAATKQWGMYLALFLIAIGIVQLIMYITQPRAVVGEEYRAAAARVKALQEERRGLLAELKLKDEE